MAASFSQAIFFLTISIVVIIVLTAKYRVHPFFALLIGSLVVGVGLQIPFSELLTLTKDGFGTIMKSLGLIIVLGTTLGVLLEHTGSTQVMAGFILKITGERRAPLAMSITGFIVGLPIFCDSGYIVLNGLNQSMAKRTGISPVIMSVSLATGLYSVHCLIPPHPGAAAAAATMGVDFGKLILIGVLVALPAMLVGYGWARFAGKKMPRILPKEDSIDAPSTDLPSVINSFLPVLIPIFLIATKSFLSIEQTGPSLMVIIFSTLGDPVIALSIGVLLAFNCGRRWKRESVSQLLQEAAEKAGSILVIIGAGGAFGAVLGAAQIGKLFGSYSSLNSLGIIFPFLLTFVLKTSQGSSTVAIITAASIVFPLLHTLGLDSANGRLLCVLSMGAGSMMISHANDAYFWVIAKFSGLDTRSMLKVYSVATALMGLITLLMLYLVSLFLC